jgi:hypothetical protein
MANTPKEPGFCVTEGKGFQITFENGWTVSVQFGGGNYSGNYDLPVGSGRAAPVPPSSTAEIAAWDPAGQWYEFGTFEDEYRDTVKGYCPPATVLAFMKYVAGRPALRSTETGERA